MYKKINLILILIMAISSVSLAVDYQVPLALTAPVIDANDVVYIGDSNDTSDPIDEWADALNVYVANPETLAVGGTNAVGTPTHTDLSADIKLLWDADHLYIYARVYDTSMSWEAYPGPFNGGDCLQILFNPFNDQSAGFLDEATIFDCVPETSDGMGAAIYSHSTYYSTFDILASGKELSDGWMIEIAIPWGATFNEFGYPGSRHGFSIGLIDYDGGTSPSNFMIDFGNGTATIDDISTWNTLTLIGENNCGVNGRLAGDLNGDCYVDLEDLVILAQQWAQNTLGE